MAKDPNPELESDTPIEEVPKQPKSYRMHILVGLVLLVLIQTTVMYMLLPDPKTIRDQTRDAGDHLPDIGDTQFNPIPPAGGEKVETVERKLGERFNIEQTNPAVPGGQLTFSVSLVVEIAKKDENAFDKIYPTKESRIRQEAEIILRNSTLADRKEATLGTIRRRLRDKINEVIDENKNYVRDVLGVDAKEGEM